MATLADVAREAGVSVSAVSRVLSNDPRGRVSAETRARVARIAGELGYRPNFAGRALRSSRTFSVALVVPDLTNAVFSELTEGVEEEALRLGYVVLLGRAETMQPGGDGMARLIEENRVDGLLLQPRDGTDLPTLLGQLDRRVPTVLINTAAQAGVTTVSLPDEAATGLAVDHLVGLGHRRIGLINGLPSSGTAGRRLRGFRTAMGAHGLDADGCTTHLGYHPQDGRAAMRQVLAHPERPTAVVVANVNAALGALSEAHSAGVTVPQELSLIAIHDAWPAESTSPPLTTVRLPLAQMGRHAMAALHRQLTDATVTAEVVPAPPVLVRRQSTTTLDRPS